MKVQAELAGLGCLASGLSNETLSMAFRASSFQFVDPKTTKIKRSMCTVVPINILTPNETLQAQDQKTASKVQHRL